MKVEEKERKTERKTERQKDRKKERKKDWKIHGLANKYIESRNLTISSCEHQLSSY
jgi:hypothetical protein